MNNEMILNKRDQNQNVALHQMAAVINHSLRSVTSYYSKVLERELNIRQTLCLLNAQLAFIVTVFPIDCSFIARILCACWLIHALLKCKEVL